MSSLFGSGLVTSCRALTCLPSLAYPGQSWSFEPCPACLVNVSPYLVTPNRACPAGPIRTLPRLATPALLDRAMSCQFLSCHACHSRPYHVDSCRASPCLPRRVEPSPSRRTNSCLACLAGSCRVEFSPVCPVTRSLADTCLLCQIRDSPSAARCSVVVTLFSFFRSRSFPASCSSC